MRAARRPVDGHRASRRRLPLRTHASHAAAAGATLAGRQRARAATVAARSGRSAASTARQLGTLWKRCEGGVACANAANGKE